MKKLVLFAVAILVLFSCSREIGGYRVNVAFSGDLAQLRYDTLVLSSINNYDLLADTAVVVNGKAVFEGTRLDTPQSVKIEAKGNGNGVQRIAGFFLERGTSSIDVTFLGGRKSEVAIKGGSYHTIADSLAAMEKRLLDKCNIDSLIEAKAGRTVLFEIYESVGAEVEKVAGDYIVANPTSLYALERLAKELENIPLQEAEAKLAAFEALPEYAANKRVAKVAEIIGILKSLRPGEIAPDFTIEDDSGNPVRFSDFYRKNKVTMLDFWSSRCSPCRAFNPTLSKIYKEYKEKGFDIIAVSLDKNKDAWLKAIEEDNVAWTQVSELKGWDSEVAKQYYVRAIPQSIFVDRQGRIIKRKPSHEEIVELLEANL